MTKDIRYATGVVASSDGTRFNTAERLKAITEAGNGVYKAFNNGEINAKAFDASMSRLENEAESVRQEQRNAKTAAKWSGSADSAEQWQANGGAPSSDGVARKCKNISPMDVPVGEWRNMFEALRHKQPYRTEIGTKGFSDGSGIGFKTPGAPVAEGAPWPTGLLPPTNVPGLTQELPFEPDRLADHIPSITIDAKHRIPAPRGRYQQCCQCKSRRGGRRENRPRSTMGYRERHSNKVSCAVQGDNGGANGFQLFPKLDSARIAARVNRP